MIMNPSAIENVVLDGHSLNLESFVAVARYNATVELAGSALEAMKKSRALAEKIAEEGRVAYGITTGFGDFQKVAVPEEMSNQLSTNLILSHCTGAGEPYTEEVVRGMLLLRANALCGGVSGVRPLLVEMMIEMLNKGVHPWVPQKGSLGSSGDLAPLAHMTLPMLGKGQAYYKGELMSGADAMAKAGIATLDTLVCKEGLGMTNGTCAMTSVGSLALYDTICAAQLGDVIGSLDFEGLTGLRNAFDPRIHQVRGQKGQMLVAENMRKLLEGSEILDNCQTDRVQDAYALRCIPRSTAPSGTPWTMCGTRWRSSSTPSPTTPSSSWRTRRSSPAATSTASLWPSPSTPWALPAPRLPTPPSAAPSGWSTPPCPTALPPSSPPSPVSTPAL